MFLFLDEFLFFDLLDGREGDFYDLLFLGRRGRNISRVFIFLFLLFYPFFDLLLELLGAFADLLLDLLRWLYFLLYLFFNFLRTFAAHRHLLLFNFPNLLLFLLLDLGRQQGTVKSGQK